MSKFKSVLKTTNPNINKFSFSNIWKLSNGILYKKYSSFKYSYTLICVNNLMFNEKCRIVSIFKDYLIYDDDTEFFRTNYEKESLLNTQKKVYDFYDKYNKVFPNYMILPENVYMYKNLRKKQKMIDINNKIMLEKEKNEKKFIKGKKKENKIIFDEHVKENINRLSNSMITISLANTIISNYINYNEYKKNENENISDKNNSFVESNINNSSFNISLYNKRSLFNDNNNTNNNNQILFNDTMKSESSLENIVAILNNKNFQKIKINNEPKNKKIYKNLSINIFSNNTNNKYNDNNNDNIVSNEIKTHNYMNSTPPKNGINKNIKKTQVQHRSLNNNRKFFVHKKNASDVHGFCCLVKNTTGFLSKQKPLKFVSKFPKEENNNIIEKLTSSLIYRYKNKQRNKTKRKTEEKNLVEHSKNKNENLTKSSDNNKHLNKKFSNSKERKRIKVNNYFTFKRMSKQKYSKNGECMKYNKIVKTKRKKTEEKESNRDNSKNEKIYGILEERLKVTFNNKIKEKRKENNTKPTIDTDSTESTKISLNNRKTKFNFYITYDKINNSSNSNNQMYIYNNNIKNKSNKEILQTQPKDENISNNCNYNYNTLNNFNININYNNINNTELAVINNYTYENNINKNNNQKQKKVLIDNMKKCHKKYKTYTLQMINNNDIIFSFNNKKSSLGENKMNYMDNKLKKIKEEITKNKYNFKEIKDKQRKLSENNNAKILSYGPTPLPTRKYDKMATSSILGNNSSVGRNDNNSKIKNNIIIKNMNKNKEFMSGANYKAVKTSNDNITYLHTRNFSVYSNNFKSPFAKNLIKQSTKENIQKNKDKKQILNQRLVKKIKCIKKINI